VYYHTENNPQTARVTSAKGTGATVGSLEPDRAYYFWISAVIGSAEGEKSPPLNVKTPSIPVVQNLRAGTAAADSVFLSWSGVDTGLSYKVYYNTVNNPRTARVVDASGTSATVGSLEPNRVYYFWISAVAGSAEGGKSPALRVKTTSIPAVQNLRAGTVGSDSVSLSWSSAGTGLSYKVYYNTVNNLRTAREVDASGTDVTIGSLEPNSAYYFWISAVASNAEGRQSAVLNVTTTYAIGDRGPAGGWIFYDKGVVSDGWRFLEAAPHDIGPAQWGADGRKVKGTAPGVGTGKRNTRVIVRYLRLRGKHDTAAQLCDKLAVGDRDKFDDWFLPSRNELGQMYHSLKQKGLGRFSNSWYWSSSQDDDSYSWALDFNDGSSYFGKSKDKAYLVRAVRAF
jgi:hypothetical protein